MRRSLLVSLFASALFASSPVLAEDLEHEESGLTFSLPKGWTYEADEDVLTAESADGNTVLVFIVSDEKDAEKLVDAVGEELDAVVKNAEVTQDAKEEKVNGLTQIYTEGTGTCDGEKCDWDMTIVLGAKKSLMVVALGDIEKNQSSITKVYRSIKKSAAKKKS